MAQGNGYWYNPEKQIALEVNRHEHDIKKENVQKILDLHWAAVDDLKELPITNENEDKIKMTAVEAGQIRARDWQNFFSVQLAARKRKLQDTLGALADLIQGFKDKSSAFKKLTPQTQQFAKDLATSWTLKIDNLATKSTQSLSPDEFLKSYADEGFLEESNWDKTNRSVRDIPMGGGLYEEVCDSLRKRGYYKDMEIKNLFEDDQVNYSMVENKKLLDEEKLSRVWQMAKNKGFVWGIITGYRGDNDEATNEAINKKLKKDVRDVGYGFWELEGHWVETDEAGKKDDTVEKSLFVGAPKGTDPQEFLKFMMEMTQKYDQDASIYKTDPEPDAPVMLYQYKSGDGDGRKVDEDHFSIGKFHPNKIAQGYSRVLGSDRTFIFESVGEIGE